MENTLRKGVYGLILMGALAGGCKSAPVGEQADQPIRPVLRPAYVDRENRNLNNEVGEYETDGARLTTRARRNKEGKAQDVDAEEVANRISDFTGYRTQEVKIDTPEVKEDSDGRYIEIDALEGAEFVDVGTGRTREMKRVSELNKGQNGKLRLYLDDLEMDDNDRDSYYDEGQPIDLIYLFRDSNGSNSSQGSPEDSCSICPSVQPLGFIHPDGRMEAEHADEMRSQKYLQEMRAMVTDRDQALAHYRAEASQAGYGFRTVFEDTLTAEIIRLVKTDLEGFKRVLKNTNGQVKNTFETMSASEEAQKISEEIEETLEQENQEDN